MVKLACKLEQKLLFFPTSPHLIYSNRSLSKGFIISLMGDQLEQIINEDLISDIKYN